MVRILKFLNRQEEGLYYLCGENKCGDQQLICSFVFAYANCYFFHAAAPITLDETKHYVHHFRFNTCAPPRDKQIFAYVKLQIHCTVTAELIRAFIFATHNDI